jgi:pimeloyl-ACP methyl ester carboxylesterase
MASFTFNQDSRFDGFNNNFVILGKKWEILSQEEKEKVLLRIDKKSTEILEEIWGTLGWKSDNPFTLNGTIHYSENGNHKSKGATLKEVENIWEFNPLAAGKGFVKERYINFDDLEFEFPTSTMKANSLPKLRLTVFLQEDEGALVYYQHSDKGNFNDDEAEVEYILPEATDSTNSTKRNRLTYYFDVIPKSFEEDDKKPGYIKLAEGELDTSFIVKILTFKRNPLHPKELINEAINTLNVNAIGNEAIHKRYGQSKYRLLKYDVLQGDFIDNPTIDPEAKTLLLVHGTFSSTMGSYGDLYLKKFDKETCFLEKLLTDKIYDQIIAFDHPTITHDVFQNSRELYQFLGNTVFTQPVDVVGTSRGALFAKWLAADTANRHFVTNKVMTFSGANGVGYYTSGEHINLALKVWKKLAVPGTKFIAVLAQFSADFFLKQPGNRQMKPNSKRLKRVLDAHPLSTTTRYQCVAADWDKKLPHEKWKKAPTILLDAVIKLVLGRKHDWVVGTEQQKISPSGYSEPVINIKSVHVKNLDLDYVKDVRLKKTDTHQLIYDFMSS